MAPMCFPECVQELPAVIVPLLAGFRDRFVYTKITTIDLLTIELADRSGGCILIFHLDESETLRTLGLAIIDDVGTEDSTILGEHVPKLFLGGVVTDVSDINFLCHDKHSSTGMCLFIKIVRSIWAV